MSSLESTDPVRVSFLLALLRDAGIECIVLDAHISALEGGIGAFPRRLVVAEDDLAQARRVLRERRARPARTRHDRHRRH